MDIAWESDRIRWGWAVVGLGILMLVVFVLQQFIPALVFAIFIYYSMRRVYRWLDGYLAHPDLTVTLTLLVLVLPVLAIVAYALFVALRQLGRVVTTHELKLLRSVLQPYIAFSRVPIRVNDPGDLVRVLTNYPQRALEPSMREVVQQLFGQGTTLVETLFSFLGQVFVMFVFVFYLLRDDYKISGWVRTTAGDASGVVDYLEAVDADLEVMFLGNLLTIFATGAVATGVYTVLSIIAPPSLSYPYSVLLGALTGIATLIPVVGIKIVYVPFSLYLLYRALTSPASIWFPVVFFVIALAIVDTIPDIFIRSYLSARSLHFGLVLLAYTLGVIALGWVGLFLGPIILVLFLRFMQDIIPDWARSRSP